MRGRSKAEMRLVALKFAADVVRSTRTPLLDTPAEMLAFNEEREAIASELLARFHRGVAAKQRRELRRGGA